MNIKDRTEPRFSSEKNTSIWISEDGVGEFRKDILAIVINESKHGLNLVMVNCKDLKQNQIIKVSTLDDKIVKCSVVWIREVDEGIFRAGIESLEEPLTAR